HGLYKIQPDALAVREAPLVEIALQHAVRVVLDLAVLLPGHAGHGRRILEPLEEVQEQLLAVAAADEIDLGHLHLDELGVERREDAAERDLDLGIGRPELPGED